MDRNIPHVVIIGAGFGGLTTAQSLKRAAVRITIVDRTNHHLFQPLLYQVAMAGLSPADIAAPIRSLVSEYPNVRVLLGSVQSLDLDRSVVITDIGSFEFDYLIMSCGATHS